LPPWPEHGPPTEVVLFDLGGVLVELRGVDDMRRLSGMASDDDIMQRWLECRWVRQFESGACAAEEFAAGVVADWGLSVGTDIFLESFMGWPRSLFEGATELVADTSQACAVACLSNTNALHWEFQVERWGLEDLFEKVFLSYRLGMVKPDGDIFHHVVDALGVPAEQIVLLDDSQLNVDGARSVGPAGRPGPGPGGGEAGARPSRGPRALTRRLTRPTPGSDR
jgi:glucose-1-phosphatase